jgi:hypothetical protein
VARHHRACSGGMGSAKGPEVGGALIVGESVGRAWTEGSELPPIEPEVRGVSAVISFFCNILCNINFT